MKHPAVTRLVRIALFTAIALTVFILESYLPPLIPVPGVKLGLANMVTLIVLLLMKPLDALVMLALRIVLGAVFTGQAVSLCYSAAGGACCFLTMWGLKVFLGGHFPPLISIFGALAHHAGQLCVAALLMQTTAVFAYLPVLMIAGALTGTVTGLAAALARRYLQSFFRAEGRDPSHV